jgi:cyclic pyranopterin monophosphate synthase
MAVGKRLSHVGPGGRARMVDVSSKKVSEREARARAFVAMSPPAVKIVRDGGLEKGDALAVAKVAGIMGAKRTPELIPLCHPIALTSIDVDLKVTDGGVAIETTVKTADRTGVEMEALTAASVAALTIYDMCKSVDKGISITSVELLEKRGGKSGEWRRDA